MVTERDVHALRAGALAMLSEATRAANDAPDVESALGMKIEAELPYDPFLYLKAVNEGIPIVLGAPQSVAAARLRALSGTAFGADGAVMPPAAAAKKKGRFALRRR